MKPLACLITLLLITPSVASAMWCPFCEAPSQTLAEQADESTHLLLAKWLGGIQPTPESAGTARFQVVKVAKSEGDLFMVDSIIELPQYIAGKKDGLYVLMGPSAKLINWHVPKEASESSWEYVSNLPPLVEGVEAQAKRLAYFIDYLEHPELTVSNDAYAEFAAARYEVITPNREKFPREKLRQWILDPDTPVTRLGLYGLLLGLCGNEEDAEAMKQKILIPDSDFRLGIEGVMSGYILIAGEAGLNVLEDAKMKAKTYVNQKGEEVKLPFSETYATMQALRFLWTYEPDRLPKQRLKESMRTLLSRPDLADIVIADLARWEDWDVQEQLMTMYDAEAFDIPSVKRAIVRYLVFCSKVKGEDSEQPEYAIAAAERLKVLEAKDPKTVRNAQRFLFR